MTVITAPHKLNPETPLSDNISLINDNYDKILSDLADLKPRQFTTAIFAPATLVPNQHQINTLTAFDLPDYDDYAIEAPQVDIYIDSLTSDHIWPDGSALSSGQRNMQVCTIIRITPVTDTPPFSSTLTRPIASYTITIENCDSSNHDVYTVASNAVFSKVIGEAFR